jgi:uncharacterized protein (TIGR02246 family)
MKTSVFSALLFCAFALFQHTIHAQSANDEQSVRNFLNSGLQAWFAGDVDKAANCYAENATVVDWMGKQNTGRAAIRAGIVQALAQDKPTPENFSMTIKDIRFLNPTVAVASFDLKGKGEMDGKTIEWAAVSTMVISRKTGNWQIEMDQTTGIAPPQGQ